MQVLKNIVVLFSIFLFSTVVFAQKTKPTKARDEVVKKYTPPKLVTFLGIRSDSSIVSVDEALQLIKQSLIITDDKKIGYTITSYQCMYKRKGVTEDEVSGKVSPTSSIVANLFKTTPLPELWRKIISEQLKRGEEIFFFDIVVKDAKGHLAFAPNLKLIIQ